MENDKQGFIGFAGNMGKKAKVITASAAKAIKTGGETAIDKFGQYRTEQELKKMKPVFPDDLLTMTGAKKAESVQTRLVLKIVSEIQKF